MSEVELLSKIAWIIGAIIIVIAGVGCVTLIGAWSLDSIIRYTKFGKEFFKYCKWRRLQVSQSRTQEEER